MRKDRHDSIRVLEPLAIEPIQATPAVPCGTQRGTSSRPQASSLGFKLELDPVDRHFAGKATILDRTTGAAPGLIGSMPLCCSGFPADVSLSHGRVLRWPFGCKIRRLGGSMELSGFRVRRESGGADFLSHPSRTWELDCPRVTTNRRGLRESCLRG
jgi:hypothetical protein